tara:strand:+ start:376 stop:1158 length:783 start_codon:yes stop_codon:yes gene_type:complete
MNNTTKCYTFSGDELIRICFGLEQRFQRLHQFMRGASADAELALDLVVQIVQYADRYDLKNKYVRFFRLAKKYYQVLSDHPQVDSSLLSDHIAQFDGMEAKLYGHTGMLTEELTNNPFLQILKKQSSKSDIGTLDLLCSYLQAWLSRSRDACLSDIEYFYRELQWLESNTVEVLRFLRDNSSVHQATTSDGYYQYELSQGLSQLYMINVFVDSDQLVPVVSVDRRRLLLKFNYMSVADKSKSPHVIHGDKVDFSLGIGAL